MTMEKNTTASEDEVLRKEQKPRNVSEDDVKSLTKSLFGYDVIRVKPLPSYDDLNFYIKASKMVEETPPPEKKQKVSSSSSEFHEFVFKIHNGVESSRPEFLEAMNAVFRHLNRQGLSVPHPICGKNGSFIQFIVRGTAEKPVRHAVRLLSWIEGKPLGSSPCSTDLLYKSGRYLGRMRRELDVFSFSSGNDESEKSREEPAERARAFCRLHSWDLRQMSEVSNFLHAVTDIERRKLAKSVVESFNTIVKPKGEEGNLRTAVLQADWNDANIIVSNKMYINGTFVTTKEMEVNGIIDFGDSVWSWVVNDIAIALAYVGVTAMTDSLEFVDFEVDETKTKDENRISRALQSIRAFMRGFKEVYSLTEEEKTVLPLLVACRLAMSGTFAYYTSSKDKSNEYITVHSEPAWRCLNAMWNRNNNGGGEVSKLFQNAFI